MASPAAVSSQPSDLAASRPEWWEVWGQRRAHWLADHPTLVRRVAWVRTVGLWLALVYLLVGLALAPELRWGVRAWVGAVWVVVAWFFVARTKTLTWSGFMRFFAVCGAWSLVVGWVLTRVSSWRGMWGTSGTGPLTMVAGVGEEALKLVPLAMLAVLAPRRVARFAAVDFALLGIAAGAAFEGVEEAARRTAYFAPDPTELGLAGLDRYLYEGLPPGWTTFGLWPIPSDWSNGPAGFGGHVVTTGLVAALVGLGVVAWRAAARRRLVVRWSVRAAAVVVPVAGLVSVMADHMALNAQGRTAEDWLDPAVSAVPWWLRVPWSALGHGHCRPAVLVVLVVACLMVDGFVLAARPWSSLLPGSAWGPVTRVGAWLSGWHARSRWPGRAVASTANALLALVWITGRDWGQQVAAHARQRGEPRRESLRRGRTAVAAQRALREAVMEDRAGAVRPWVRRLVAVGLLAGLVVMALVVAPDLASRTGPGMHRVDPSWLGGVLDGLADWWDGLSGSQKIAIGVGIAALVVLSGGSVALGMGISGAALWGLDHASGIGTFARDPRAATRDYFANATPAQLAVDGGELLLTFTPGAFGATAGRGVRAAAKEFADDPAAAWARVRAARGDEGAAQIPGRRPRGDEPAAGGSPDGAFHDPYPDDPAWDPFNSEWHRPSLKPPEPPSQVTGYRSHAIDRLEGSGAMGQGVTRQRVEDLVSSPRMKPKWQPDKDTWLYVDGDLQVSVNVKGQIVTVIF